jgi:hypothetical protein
MKNAADFLPRESKHTEIKCVPDLVWEKRQEQVERQSPFQCGGQVGASQPVIVLKVASEAFKIQAVVSYSARSDTMPKRGDQIAIKVAPYLRRGAKSGRDIDHNCL